MPEHQGHLRHVPAQFMATIRRRVVVPNVQAFTHAARQTLWATATAQGLRPAVRFCVIFHDHVDHENHGLVESCLPCGSGALAPAGEVYVREEPARCELYTISLTHPRYPKILGADDAVAAQVRARGLTCPLSPPGVDVADVANLGLDAPFDQVAYPVIGAPRA